jgi:glutathione S-transferase
MAALSAGHLASSRPQIKAAASGNSANGAQMGCVAQESPKDARNLKTLGDCKMTYQLTALVTLAMVAHYVWTAILVGGARRTHKVKAPETTGPDDFNRVYRAHVNSLEQLVAMLPVLWIFAITVSDRSAALLGLVWLVGRVVYVLAYKDAADKRGTGFMIGFLAMLAGIIGSAAVILVQMAR